jgi:hypothetical protein
MEHNFTDEKSYTGQMRGISKMTDRELQEGMYYNIRQTLFETRRTSKNVAFFFWMTVVNVVCAFIYFAQ